MEELNHHIAIFARQFACSAWTLGGHDHYLKRRWPRQEVWNKVAHSPYQDQDCSSNLAHTALIQTSAEENGKHEDGMQVDKDLREMLIRKDAPKPKLIGLRIWRKAIPQFNVGHQDLLEVLTSSLPPSVLFQQHSAAQMRLISLLLWYKRLRLSSIPLETDVVNKGIKPSESLNGSIKTWVQDYGEQQQSL